MNPMDAVKTAVESGNVQEAIQKAEGTYTEKVKPGEAANYPQNDLPSSSEPVPFTLGPISK